MTGDDLLNALGEIDEKYLTEIEHVRDERRRKKQLFRRIGSVAAAAALVLCLVPAVLLPAALSNPNGGGHTATGDSLPPQAGIPSRPQWTESMRKNVYRAGERAGTPYGAIEYLRVRENGLTLRFAKTDGRTFSVFLWGKEPGDGTEKRVTDGLAFTVNGEEGALPDEAGMYELSIDYSSFTQRYELSAPYITVAEASFYLGERALQSF